MRGRRPRGHAGRGGAPASRAWNEASADNSSEASRQGLLHVGNATLSQALTNWLDARHRSMPCSWHSRVWFAPFSPNGIGNKLMAMVMAFHMALTQERALVVTDWPPRTLDTAYKLRDIMQPSSCQARFYPIM